LANSFSGIHNSKLICSVEERSEVGGGLDIEQQLTTYHTTFLDLEEIRVTSLLYHSQIHCDPAYSATTVTNVKGTR
jgi:hypothetical protein